MEFKIWNVAIRELVRNWREISAEPEDLAFMIRDIQKVFGVSKSRIRTEMGYYGYQPTIKEFNAVYNS